MIHELKSWRYMMPENDGLRTPNYGDIIGERKSYDYRKNDRDFKPGDWLYLREYIPGTITDGGYYTGRACHCLVTGVDYPPGTPDGYVILRILFVRTLDNIPAKDAIESVKSYNGNGQ